MHDHDVSIFIDGYYNNHIEIFNLRENIKILSQFHDSSVFNFSII